MNLLKSANNAISIKLISTDDFQQMSSIPRHHKKWMQLHQFEANEGDLISIASASGDVEQVYFGVGKQGSDVFLLQDPFNLAKLNQLPPATYKIEQKLTNAEIAYFAFALADYKFDRYKKTDVKLESEKVLLVIEPGLDFNDIENQIAAIGLTRDLINTPANDMGPEELAFAIQNLADNFNAEYRDIIGDTLLEQGFNLIHTVGRASDRAPRLVELKWRSNKQANLPKLTLVGKGVIFDTGGLDLKPAAGMLLMKKDMGGAANVIGLAQMIMTANLPVELTLLVGAVENSVSSNAFRPSDILTAYNGTTVEIGNTDAEGRLVLADLLALADEAQPDLMIDMATLTGAARVAVGPEIAAFFTDDTELAQDLVIHSAKTEDAIWQLPLYQPYLKTMNSKVADMNNISSMPLAGATSAALFLKHFVKNTKSYIHWDINAWNISERLARPIGGEAMGIRAIFSMLKSKYEV